MRRIVWLLPLLLLAGCSAPGDTQPEGKTVHGRTPEDDKRYKEYAAHGEVRIGMVREEVRTAMGEPNRTSKTTYRRKRAVCWSYLYTDIYFDEDGFVIGYQSVTG
jgi:outer membrane protein assembly factor BamE (lipoprotein component of BamABCDE complex)